MPNVDDLRYVRTEGAIRTAFMELVAEGPVASITVSDLCRRAGISRNAFYLHHAGATELFAALVNELVEDVRAESLESAERRTATGRDDDFSSCIMNALARHETLLRALLPADDGSLAKCLIEGIGDSFAEAGARFGEHGAGMEHRLRCAFSAGAIVAFVHRWIAETDRPLSEARAQFEELAAGVADVSARHLLDGTR
ncbi:MAG: TetR/AcrR family transcriptional regulator [Coriobacteriales bacterium]|jgi:AcrR family transcriptional regulator